MDNNDPTYWNTLLDKYLSGSVSKEEMHALERRAMDDPFLMDALEGYQQDGQHATSVDELTAKVNQDIPDKKRKRPFAFRYSIAAGLALVLGATLLFRMGIDNQDKALDTVATQQNAPTQGQEEGLYADASVPNKDVSNDYAVSNEDIGESVNAPSKISDEIHKAKEVASPSKPTGAIPSIESNKQDVVIAEKKNTDLSKSDVVEIDDVATTSKPSAVFMPPQAQQQEIEEEFYEEIEEEVVVSAPSNEVVTKQRAQGATDKKEMLDQAVAQSDQVAGSKFPSDNASMLSDTRRDTLSGIVLTSAGDPLAFASVYLKQTGTGVETNIDGQFEIVVDNASDTLVVSYVGYEQSILPLSGMDSVFTVTLSENLMLDEVVIADPGDDTNVMSYILARDGETQAFPKKGLDVFKRDIQLAISKYRTGTANQIGITDVVFSVSPAGFINNIEYKFSSCNECKPIIEKLLQESEPWITIPSNQEVKIEYRFDFL